MAYRYFNPNPNFHNNGDCVIRAISKIMNQSWDKTYFELCVEGYLQKDWGDSNRVWDAYLRGCGFLRRVIPNTCPDCYTIKDFCYDHPLGEYILATGSHVVAVIDGDYYDSWDSGNEVPIFYYTR
jgi:hypothetical protein